MPETEIEIVTKEWLQNELLHSENTKNLIILDCRSSNEYIEGHIRSAVNFSIPTIMLRRLAAGKIDMFSTIKSRELKDRIQNGYQCNLFVLYNENSNFMINNSRGGARNNDGNSSVSVSGNFSTATTITTEDNNKRLKKGKNEGDSGGSVGVDGNVGEGDCENIKTKANIDDICNQSGDANHQRIDDADNNDGNNQMDFVDGDLTITKYYYNHDAGTTVIDDGTLLSGSGSSGTTNFFDSNCSGISKNNSGSSGGSIGGVIGFGGNTNTTNNVSNSSNCILEGDPTTNTSTINVLHRKLKQDGCRVVCLQGGYSSFRNTFPEWCKENNKNQEIESGHGTTQTDQLMGLRSLRISTPHSDSACSSSTESSDCESTTHYHHYHYPHQHINEAPVEIVPGLFLGNASHSGDSDALQKYNIKYVLNVTPDLPNHFEASGCGIQYLQIPITDHYSQDLAVHFPAAINFIEEARSKGSAVLVHCLAGVSRSVTVTLAYLMHTKSLCLNDAFSLVRDRKPDVAPNFHFMEQLHSFERQLKIQNPNHHHIPHHCHHHHHHHHHHNNDSIMTPSSSTSSTTTTTTTTDGVNSSSSSSTKSQLTECEKCQNHTTCDNCIENIDKCKCMQIDFLARVKTTGVSPDSGIEFDRWTPSLDSGGSGGGVGSGVNTTGNCCCIHTGCAGGTNSNCAESENDENRSGCCLK